MRKSVISELWYKVALSGSRLNLFIGINSIIFVAIGFISVAEWLFTRNTSVASLIKEYMSLPAYLPELMYKFWTPLTYMFGHAGFFHFLFNMLWLYWIGQIFEDFLSGRQFTFAYLSGGLAGALLYILFYNIFPAFSNVLPVATLIGASASVMAVVVATATLLPNFSIRLLLFGDVKLKYLVLVFIIIDIIGIAELNAGGSIAHLGGALMGFIFIKQLQSGNDWSRIFAKKKKLKVAAKNYNPKVPAGFPDQDIIDTILDKISKSGYDSLSRKEKEELFKASNKE
ncbi:rhomboid family intramembrane serine protease [Arcticibacter eurypsychrophilus]|uniref:rhomboid family intramembrane serine protease n=1 Tax=Arcticibacter eurypsychrophilus TaxID=1434752 RepID=UPI00084DDB1A|nr:rhomboid family intramembrane serine protease [Arcticibacter eurypsychrophilus]